MKYAMLLLLLLGFTACKQDYVKTPRTLSSVKKARVVALESSSEPLPVYAVGKIEADENIRLSFKIGGVIAAINFEKGQYVQKGQLMATLEQEEINSQVTEAEANVEKMRRDLQRFQRLFADSAATLESVQDIETGLRIAESGLRIARFNRRYSEIVAPASGRILQRLAEPNELVSGGSPIYLMASQEEGMVLTVGLSDKDIVKLRLGDPAMVRLDAYPGKMARAEVNELAAEAHPVAGTFDVELRIVEFPYELKAGFFAKAEILPSQQEEYIKVPMHALVEGLDNEVAVFTVSEEKAKRTIVSPQFIGDDFFTVEVSQLQSKQVITDGAAYLRDGEAFETIND